MEVKFEHTVSNVANNIRFLDYAVQVVTTLISRNGIKKAIKSGQLLLNGKAVESGRYIQSGDVITHIQINEKNSRVFELVLPVIYEDEHMALINKPAGFSVSGNYFRTIRNALPFNLKRSNESDALPSPMPVHRLDNQTSGLLLIAKTKTAQVNLGEQFEEKSIQKTYQAIVLGNISGKDIISIPIEGKTAKTCYEVLKTVPSLKFEALSLVKLMPATGRTHQLRIHLSLIGHPILGDKLYTAPEKLLRKKGLFLAACAIRFLHPVTNNHMDFEIARPNKFNVIMEKECHRVELNSDR
jgi:RluA family pseudouridine synthase